MHEDTRHGFRFELGRMFARLACGGCFALTLILVFAVIVVAVNGPAPMWKVLQEVAGSAK